MDGSSSGCETPDKGEGTLYFSGLLRSFRSWMFPCCLEARTKKGLSESTTHAVATAFERGCVRCGTRHHALCRTDRYVGASLDLVAERTHGFFLKLH